MKKMGKFLLIFFILLFFTLVLSIIYHLKIGQIDKTWILYYFTKDLVRFLPLIASLSILWSLVFRNKGQMREQRSGSLLGFLLSTLIVFIAAFALNEFALQKTYETAEQNLLIQSFGTNNVKNNITPMLEDQNPEDFTEIEFENLKYFLYKENVAFSMGTIRLMFDKLYNVDGKFYIEGLKIIAYFTNNNIDYIIVSDRGKEVDDKLYIKDPIYFEYTGDKITDTIRIDGNKSVSLIYEMKGIYELAPSSGMENFNVLNIFIYNDYLYNSKINFYQLGNIIFNKISYYMILLILLIVSASLGWAMENKRIVKKDVFQMISFYVVSFVLTAIAYDLLIRLVDTIYAMVV